MLVLRRCLCLYSGDVRSANFHVSLHVKVAQVWRALCFETMQQYLVGFKMSYLEK